MKHDFAYPNFIGYAPRTLGARFGLVDPVFESRGKLYVQELDADGRVTKFRPLNGLRKEDLIPRHPMLNLTANIGAPGIAAAILTHGEPPFCGDCQSIREAILEHRADVLSAASMHPDAARELAAYTRDQAFQTEIATAR